MSLLGPSLEAFLAVVDKTTVQGASHSLGLTQTGVTQRIRTLEKQLGVTLFLRSRKGMVPTSEGEALHRYCIAARELEGRALAQIRGRDSVSTTEIVICGPSSLMRSRVIPRTADIFKKRSNLRGNYQITDGHDVLERLKKGDAHLGILDPEQVVLEMDSRKLKSERYILVGPSAWKKRSLDEIIETESIVDFDSEDTHTFDFLEKYRWLTKCRKERHSANNTDALTSLLVAGLGYSVLSEEFAQDFIKSGDLIDLAPGKFLEKAAALAWYPRSEMPEYLKALIDAIAGS